MSYLGKLPGKADVCTQCGAEIAVLPHHCMQEVIVPEDEPTQKEGQETEPEDAAEAGEEEAAAPAAEQGEGAESHITDADAEEIARQAARTSSFRALVKGPQVATNTEGQDCFKVTLSVTDRDLNLYQLHQEVARFANSTVLVSLTPLPDAPARPQPHPGQLELGEGGEPEVELVMCPDCSGTGDAGDENLEGKCPACEGQGKIPLAILAITMFRLLRCEGCGRCFSTKDAENAQPGQACPTCADAILAFVEPPTEEPAGEPAQEAEPAE